MFPSMSLPPKVPQMGCFPVEMPHELFENAQLHYSTIYIIKKKTLKSNREWSRSVTSETIVFKNHSKESRITELKEETSDSSPFIIVFPHASLAWDKQSPLEDKAEQDRLPPTKLSHHMQIVGLPLILSPSSSSESLSDWNRSLNSFLSSAFFSWTFFRLISGRSKSSIFSNTIKIVNVKTSCWQDAPHRWRKRWMLLDSYPLFSRDLQLDLLLPHLLPLAVVPAEGSSLLLGLLLPGHLAEDVLISIWLTATGNSVIIRS